MSKGRILRLFPALLLPAMLFSAALAAQNTMNVHSGGAVHVAPGAEITFFGNLRNDGTFSSSGGSTMLKGATRQQIGGISPITTHLLIVNNERNVKVNNQVEIRNALIFVNGKILTDNTLADRQFVHFLDDATYTGATNARFIKGGVRKTGNDAFIFPIGEGNNMQAVGISAPASATDHFTAYYEQASPTENGYNIDSIGQSESCKVLEVSSNGYWMLTRTGGDSEVAVTLEYDDNLSAASIPEYLLVMRWTGNEWVNEGNGGVGSTPRGKSLSSGTGCNEFGQPKTISNFSLFTIGFSGSSSLLPIQLLEFSAQPDEQQVHVYWSTASETNNDFFTVERSADGTSYDPVHRLPGAGNSDEKLDYTFTDTHPVSGINYYRLKQTDFDGHFSYSHTVRVEVTGLDTNDLSAYPNPTNGSFTIQISSQELPYLKLYNELGQEIPLKPTKFTDREAEFDISYMPSGVYLLQAHTSATKLILK